MDDRAARRRWLAGLAALSLWPGGRLAFAAPPPAADAQAARTVIQAQLEAFAADDAVRAFSYAAPALRERFGTPQVFLAMVRAAYPVVHRPAAVAFLVAQMLGGELVQPVHFTDSAGELWLALYRLQRQPDRSWRISACELSRARGLST